MHKGFHKFIQESWELNVDLAEASRTFMEKVSTWNMEVFGDITHRKRVWGRMEGVQRALAVRPTLALIKLEDKLNGTRNELLRQEEMLWHQKSRVSWLNCGDMNTKFFHTSTLIRQRRNKVEGLLNENQQWEYDQVKLKELAIRLYSNLYTTNLYSGGGDLPRGCSPQLTLQTWRGLNR